MLKIGKEGWKQKLGKSMGILAALEVASLAGTYFFYKKTNSDPDFRCAFLKLKSTPTVHISKRVSSLLIFCESAVREIFSISYFS